MHRPESKRFGSQGPSKDKSKTQSDEFTTEDLRPSSNSKPKLFNFKSSNPPKPPKPFHSENSIEGFSKLSEILAEAQSEILSVYQKISEKNSGKLKLWEIFTCLNNRIWTVLFKNPEKENSHRTEIKDLNTQLVEANLEIKNLKFKLNNNLKEEFDAERKEYEKELKELKDRNRKYIEELSSVSKEYIGKEERVRELIENVSMLKHEINELHNEKLKELEMFNIKINEAIAERNLLVQWKETHGNLLEKFEKIKQKNIILEKENSALKNQIVTGKRNFKDLEETTEEVQDRYIKQCQAYDSLCGKNRELADKLQSLARSRSKSNRVKTKHRPQVCSPAPDKFKHITKPELSHQTIEIFSYFPLITYKGLLESQEITIKLLTEKLEKSRYEQIHNNEKLKYEIEAKEAVLKKSEEYEKMIKEIKNFNQSSIAREIEDYKKKISGMQRDIHRLVDENENLQKIQKEYQNEIEEISVKSKIIVDKDLVAVQKELKCAKTLIIRNQNEISKIGKEKETVVNELKEAKKELEIEKNRKSYEIELKESNLLCESIIAKLRISHEEASQQLILKNTEINQYKENLMEKDTEMRRITQLLDRLTKDFDIQSATLADRTNEFNKATEMNEIQTNKFIEEIKILSEDYTSAIKINEELQELKQNILENNQNMIKEIEDLNHRMDIKTKELEKLNQKLIEISQENQRITESHKHLIAEKQIMEKENKELLKKIDEYKALIEFHKKEAITLKLENDTSQMILINASTKDIKEKQNIISLLTNQINELKFNERHILELNLSINKELQNLRNEILVLKADASKEISNLNNENFECMSEIEEMSKKINELEVKLLKQIELNHYENTIWEGKKKNLKSELKEKNREFVELQTKYEMIQENIKVNEGLNAEKQLLERLNKELTDKSKTFDKIEQENQKLIEIIKELEQGRIISEKHIADYQLLEIMTKENSNLKGHIEKLDIENLQKQAAFAELEKKNLKLVNEIKELEVSLSRAERNYEESAEKICLLTNYVKELEHSSNKAADLANYIKILESEVEKAKKIKEYVEELENDRDEQKKLSDYIKELENDREKARNLSDYIKKLENDLEKSKELSEQVKELENDREKARELSEYVKELEENLSKSHELSIYINDLEKQLSDSRVSSEYLKELETQKEKYKENSQYVKDLEEKAAESYALSSYIKDLEQRLQEHIKFSTPTLTDPLQVSKLTSKLQESESYIQSLELKLLKSDSKIQRLKQTKSTLLATSAESTQTLTQTMISACLQTSITLSTSSPTHISLFSLLRPRVESKEIQNYQVLLSDFSSSLEELESRLEQELASHHTTLLLLTDQKAENKELNLKIQEQNERLRQLQTEYQDILEGMSGEFTARTGNLIKKEIGRLEDRFQDYEYDVEMLKDEKEYLKFMLEQAEENLKRVVTEHKNSSRIASEACRRVKALVKWNQDDEARIMIQQEILGWTEGHMEENELIYQAKCEHEKWNQSNGISVLKENIQNLKKY